MRSLLLAVCFFAFVFAGLAQTDRGTITGTISDPGGAVIANAAVEARNTATGAVYSTASSGTGNYTVAQLPAGPYELSVTVPGFKKYVRSGLQVEVAGTARIDAVLEVGAASESVTVEAAAPLLKTEGGEVSHNISTSTFDDLPILTDNVAHIQPQIHKLQKFSKWAYLDLNLSKCAITGCPNKS